MIHLPQIIQRVHQDLTGDPVGFSKGFNLFLCLSSFSTRFISLETGAWDGRDDSWSQPCTSV